MTAIAYFEHILQYYNVGGAMYVIEIKCNEL